jgi:hypothetical protein
MEVVLRTLRAGTVPVLIAGAGLLLGLLTAYAQGWLPRELASLANSSGSWSLIAFLLALLATGPRIAAAGGAVALAALLGGYVLGTGIRGYASGSGLIIFWGLAAILVGPFLGLGAWWVKAGRPGLAALGAGGMGGVLLGEGVYGLRYIAETTSPLYWWGQIVCGAGLVGWVAARRLRRPGPIAVAALVCVAVAAAFVAAYSRGGEILGLLN